MYVLKKDKTVHQLPLYNSHFTNMNKYKNSKVCYAIYSSYLNQLLWGGMQTRQERAAEIEPTKMTAKIIS